MKEPMFTTNRVFASLIKPFFERVNVYRPTTRRTARLCRNGGCNQARICHWVVKVDRGVLYQTRRRQWGRAASNAAATPSWRMCFQMHDT